ncbi:hypothetical protein [Prevotella sp. OH937_COT-195]|uniref:hypothetical protein n=1 Tax=Prevotella sp. OH937_COT-195 TaxID=2491051 RepID=UPI000F64A5C8|nr:hypothetical protein [Prevotella sp. OH937_COT-195]RRD01880.1 hypothetical protein EII32_05485 [Prevotella sp. OH937_COT-195]
MLTSAQPFHPDAARYAFDETAAHLLNNRTKSVEGSNDRFGLNGKHHKRIVVIKHVVFSVNRYSYMP